MNVLLRCSTWASFLSVFLRPSFGIVLRIQFLEDSDQDSTSSLETSQCCLHLVMEVWVQRSECRIWAVLYGGVRSPAPFSWYGVCVRAMHLLVSVFSCVCMWVYVWRLEDWLALLIALHLISETEPLTEPDLTSSTRLTGQHPPSLELVFSPALTCIHVLVPGF